MRIFLSVLAVLVLLVVGGVVALPWLVPQGWLQATLTERLEAATGRDVNVDGSVDVQVLPRLAARVGGLTVANVEGGTAEHLLTADDVAAELAIWPLFSGRVEVNSFVLSGAEVNLEIDAAGTPNWVIVPMQTGDAAATAEPAADPDASDTAAPAVSLGEVRLVDSAVRFSDVRSGTTRSLDDLDGTIDMAALDAPLSLTLDGALDGRDLTLEMRVDTVQRLLDLSPAETTLSLRSDDLSLDFTGSAQLGDVPIVGGDLQLVVGALGSTASWLAATELELPVDAVELQTTVRADQTAVILDDLAIDVDGMTAEGALGADLAAPRPAITGTLAFGAIDVGALTGTGEAEAEPGDGTATTPEAGWSNEPLVFAPLPVDLDIHLSFESLTVPPLNLGAGDVAVTGSNGGLSIAVEQLAFYEGNAQGVVRVDPRPAGLAVANDLTLTGFRTGPLLTDLAGNGFIDGSADMSFDLNTEGGSEAELIGALAGSGNVDVGRAILHGLAGRPELEALRALLQLGGDPGAPIEIADLTATFTISDGVVANNDLEASTATLRIGGDGTVDLPERRIPLYTVTPTATGALAALEPVQNLLVPVLIEGPFDDPSVRVDPTAAAATPLNEVGDALRDAQDQVRDGDLEGAADTLLRGLGINR